jgi:hypothetical protein
MATDKEIIRQLLDDGAEPQEIASHLVDRDVAAGEYGGCSNELEAAWQEYFDRAARIWSRRTREGAVTAGR